MEGEFRKSHSIIYVFEREIINNELGIKRIINEKRRIEAIKGKEVERINIVKDAEAYF